MRVVDGNVGDDGLNDEWVSFLNPLIGCNARVSAPDIGADDDVNGAPALVCLEKAAFDESFNE